LSCLQSQGFLKLHSNYDCSSFFRSRSQSLLEPLSKRSLLLFPLKISRPPPAPPRPPPPICKNFKESNFTFYKNFFVIYKTVFEREKGHLLEIHLLEKTARHQNLDCSTLFKQMTKIYASARKSKKYAVHVLSSRCIF
jgi:hypothetical protein